MTEDDDALTALMATLWGWLSAFGAVVFILFVVVLLWS